MPQFKMKHCVAFVVFLSN